MSHYLVLCCFCCCSSRQDSCFSGTGAFQTGQVRAAAVAAGAWVGTFVGVGGVNASSSVAEDLGLAHASPAADAGWAEAAVAFDLMK